MSISRSESQTPQTGRRRSNTAQSVYKNVPTPGPMPPTPLRLGDSKTLIAWVHDPVKDSPSVMLNHAQWPGVAEGDLIRLSAEGAPGYLFIVPNCTVKHQLQVSVPRPVAEKFSIRNSGEVKLMKVDKESCCAEYIELTFQDQYLGRNEMWRLDCHLAGQCVYEEQEISFIGVIAAKVHRIYVDGKQVSSAYVTSSTKAIYRSLSAKVTIFIQVCRELWEFAGDGERYNEKIAHSFLPALFAKWREAGTNHIVTIVLISRVFYDRSEVDYAAGPLRQDDEGRWYKDFFKVITDLEVLYDWKPTLVGLKDSFWDFQRDILLTHHYHRASPSEQDDHVRLVGRLSFAHDGPILEALNLGLNPTETHYVDRSLSLTGSSTILITPGTGYFRVSKQLLRLTTTRMLDQGFALDLVSLAKPPLHQSPIFCFRGPVPDSKVESNGKHWSRVLDPLWGGDDDFGNVPDREKSLFWWEPFWMTVSFWDRQMDHPFRENRFIARAKMHEIEMLGLLDHDVLSSIEIPFLPASTYIPNDATKTNAISKEETDQFDIDVFAPPPPMPIASRNSLASVASTSSANATLRVNDGSKRSSLQRISEVNRSGLEGSPRGTAQDLPSDGASLDLENKFLTTPLNALSTSPSQSSIRSVRSTRSHRSTASASSSKTAHLRSLLNTANTAPKPAKSRFSSSWLFSPFRSGLSQPQTSPVSASTINSPTSPERTPPLPLPSTSPTAIPVIGARSPQSMAIRPLPSSRSPRRSMIEEETLLSHRSSMARYSPVGTPPRDDSFGKRWSATINSSMALSLLPSTPGSRTNPCKPLSSISYTQSSLARRWQHMFPQPVSKHDIKWKEMVTPGCLPLTVEHFPTTSELESSYDVSPYDFAVDPPEMCSFFVKPPNVSGSAEEIRCAWALVVMRCMVALRLAQGFQFVLRPSKDSEIKPDVYNTIRRSTSYVDDELNPKPAGAAEVLRSTRDAVYLSMSNEIHRIAYSGDSIQVRRYVRRMPKTRPYEYQCLIWPKLGVGYTELTASFSSHGLENYRWNRLDMLVAGYESQFSESLRYWRTRFVVIPTDETQFPIVGPMGEKLNDEEVRLLGIDKLAEMFTKARWQSPEERGKPVPPVRFLPTDLGPASCVLDENLTAQLDEIHATGPLRKKIKSERDISAMSLQAIAKAMREEEGVPIKDYRWHENKYPNSFLGSDFVSWLVREFRDVSTREQGTEWGAKLQEQGLFDHCRGTHGFLDGHYFYALRGEYIIPMTPRGGWFRAARHVSGEESKTQSGLNSPGAVRASPFSGRKTKKRLILSQSMVIDIDPNKRSDQAECVILHHDIIHNPATCFHFELQWIGTTARCIDDILRQWGRTIERYGLKLVEAYVTQVGDIRECNPFQSCFPVPLLVAPPIVPDLEKRVAEGAQTKHYFEYALLRKCGFVLDIEAADLYPDLVDVVYSYRRSPFKYSQWVHRSGVAFVQVLGGCEGFLFLTNRLMAPGRIGTTLKYQRPAAAAEDVRKMLQEVCSDEDGLTRFYHEELGRLCRAPEEPPPLRI